MTAPKRSPLSRRDAREKRQQARIRALALGGLALAGGALFGPRLGLHMQQRIRGAAFQVEIVSVLGAARLDPATLARAAGVPRGTPLFDVDPEAVVTRLEALPQVASARALRLPPNRLVVGIDERRAQGVIEGSGGAWLVCRDGVAFARADPHRDRDLPRLRVAGKTISGDPSPALAEAAAVATAASQAGFAVAEIRVTRAADPRGAVLVLRGLDTQVVLGRGAHEPGLARLVTVFSRRPGWVAAAATVDVRFSDRAVLGGDAPAETQSQGEKAPERERKAAARRGFGGSSRGPATG